MDRLVLRRPASAIGRKSNIFSVSVAVTYVIVSREKPLKGGLKSALECVRRLDVGSDVLFGGRL